MPIVETSWAVDLYSDMPLCGVPEAPAVLKTVVFELIVEASCVICVLFELAVFFSDLCLCFVCFSNYLEP